MHPQYVLRILSDIWSSVTQFKGSFVLKAADGDPLIKIDTPLLLPPPILMMHIMSINFLPIIISIKNFRDTLTEEISWLTRTVCYDSIYELFMLITTVYYITAK